MTTSVRQVPCPNCGKPSPFSPENAWRPFCSERCRMVDLGAWATESYRIPEADDAKDEGARVPDGNAPT